MYSHEAIFKAKVYGKIYNYVPKYYFLKRVEQEYEMIEESGREVENRVIWTGVIDKPLLEKDEEFHLNDLDNTVKILSRIRCSNGQVIYQTNYEFELVEDENTIKSKARAESMREFLKPENIKQREMEDKWWYRFKEWLK